MSLPSDDETVTRAQGWAAVPNWLVRDPQIPPTVKAVYTVLSSYADRDGTAYPSQARIAELIGRTERHVRRAIEVLAEKGLVEVVVRKTPTGRRNSYLLHMHPFGGRGPDTDVLMGEDTGVR